jgi:hypothetical protein
MLFPVILSQQLSEKAEQSIGMLDPSGWMYILTVEDFRYLQQ